MLEGDTRNAAAMMMQLSPDFTEYSTGGSGVKVGIGVGVSLGNGVIVVVGVWVIVGDVVGLVTRPVPLKTV